MLAFLYILLSLRELKAVLSDPVLSGLHLKLVAGVALSYLPPFYKCLGVYDMGLYVCLFSVSTTVTPLLGAL